MLLGVVFSVICPIIAPMALAYFAVVYVVRRFQRVRVNAGRGVGCLQLSLQPPLEGHCPAGSRQLPGSCAPPQAYTPPHSTPTGLEVPAAVRQRREVPERRQGKRRRLVGWACLCLAPVLVVGIGVDCTAAPPTPSATGHKALPRLLCLHLNLKPTPQSPFPHHPTHPGLDPGV